MTAARSRRVVAVALLLASVGGCSPQAIRVGVDVFDGVCAVARALGAEVRRPVAFDVFPGGTVRPVYPEVPRGR